MLPLSPVHTHCSQKSATSPLCRRFLRQSHFSATVWTGLYMYGIVNYVYYSNYTKQNKKLSCCCDSRSYRCCQTANPINNYYCGSASTNSQTAHLCTYTAVGTLSAVSARHTPRSRRSHRTALCRLTAVERNAVTVYQYWDLGLRFVFCGAFCG